MVAASCRSLMLLAVLAFAAPMVGGVRVEAQEANPTQRVKSAHEVLGANARQDDLGITVPPIPVSHPGRRYPADDAFPTGPEIGERLPEFTLKNQVGEQIDFHADRGDDKAIVVFYRSAVW